MPFTTRWDLQRIREGFERYKAEFGHYPSAQEIDAYEHLPTTRTIQRYGLKGLAATRQALGLAVTDHRHGSQRSHALKEILERGLRVEHDLGARLVEKFGEHFVHAQRPSGPGRRRTDFHVYALDYEFDVDVFYPKDYFSFVRCMNIKLKGLPAAKYDEFMVVANESISQELVNEFVSRRRNQLPATIRPVACETFWRIAAELRPLKVAD